jgi:PPP family 3-phenylpropionic acid transporter
MKPSPVWPSALYFLYFASISAVVPFLALFYRERGLSGDETGLLLSVSSVVSIFAAPFWAGLAFYLLFESRLLGAPAPASADGPPVSP